MARRKWRHDKKSEESDVTTRNQSRSRRDIQSRKYEGPVEGVIAQFGSGQIFDMSYKRNSKKWPEESDVTARNQSRNIRDRQSRKYEWPVEGVVAQFGSGQIFDMS